MKHLPILRESFFSMIRPVTWTRFSSDRLQMTVSRQVRCRPPAGRRGRYSSLPGVSVQSRGTSGSCQRVRWAVSGADDEHRSAAPPAAQCRPRAAPPCPPEGQRTRLIGGAVTDLNDSRGTAGSGRAQSRSCVGCRVIAELEQIKYHVHLCELRRLARGMSRREGRLGNIWSAGWRGAVA